jgi:hypothetical protein
MEVRFESGTSGSMTLVILTKLLERSLPVATAVGGR